MEQLWREDELVEERSLTTSGVAEVGADKTRGGGGLKTLCIKIGYSSREPRRVFLPCNKIGYVSAMY